MEKEIINQIEIRYIKDNVNLICYKHFNYGIKEMQEINKLIEEIGGKINETL